MSGINDFCFKIGTVNGTGSASANGLLMQAIFRMGIPVVGKNVFPSNIQGLPTWYEIRVSKDGYTARMAPFDLMVAMNTGTYARDVGEIKSGGYLMYDSSWPMAKALLRDDITVIGIPLGEMCNNTFTGDRERTLMKNIAYTGALAALLAIDMDVIHAMSGQHVANDFQHGLTNVRRGHRRERQADVVNCNCYAHAGLELSKQWIATVRMIQCIPNRGLAIGQPLNRWIGVEHPCADRKIFENKVFTRRHYSRSAVAVDIDNRFVRFSS